MNNDIPEIQTFHVFIRLHVNMFEHTFITQYNIPKTTMRNFKCRFELAFGTIIHFREK